MKGIHPLVAFSAIGVVLWWLQRRASYPEGRIDGTGNQAYLERIGIVGAAKKWLDDLSTRGAAYIDLFKTNESKHGMPVGLLARLAWQESRYRDDIVSGVTKSKAGATGIMQFMPSTAKALGVDPVDPAQAVEGAGRYLSSLFKRFGNWSHALMAYNWGQGNVSAWLAGKKTIPGEVITYSRQILEDIGIRGG